MQVVIRQTTTDNRVDHRKKSGEKWANFIPKAFFGKALMQWFSNFFTWRTPFASLKQWWTPSMFETKFKKKHSTKFIKENKETRYKD